MDRMNVSNGKFQTSRSNSQLITPTALYQIQQACYSYFTSNTHYAINDCSSPGNCGPFVLAHSIGRNFNLSISTMRLLCGDLVKSYLRFLFIMREYETLSSLEIADFAKLEQSIKDAINMLFRIFNHDIKTLSYFFQNNIENKIYAMEPGQNVSHLIYYSEQLKQLNSFEDISVPLLIFFYQDGLGINEQSLLADAETTPFKADYIDIASTYYTHNNSWFTLEIIQLAMINHGYRMKNRIISPVIPYNQYYCQVIIFAPIYGSEEEIRIANISTSYNNYGFHWVLTTMKPSQKELDSCMKNYKNMSHKKTNTEHYSQLSIHGKMLKEALKNNLTNLFYTPVDNGLFNKLVSKIENYMSENNTDNIEALCNKFIPIIHELIKSNNIKTYNKLIAIIDQIGLFAVKEFKKDKKQQLHEKKLRHTYEEHHEYFEFMSTFKEILKDEYGEHDFTSQLKLFKNQIMKLQNLLDLDKSGLILILEGNILNNHQASNIFAELKTLEENASRIKKIITTLGIDTTAFLYGLFKNGYDYSNNLEELCLSLPDMHNKILKKINPNLSIANDIMYNNFIEAFNEYIEEKQEVGSLDSEEDLSLTKELSDFVDQY